MTFRNIFRKTKTPSWNDLSSEKKQMVTSKLSRIIKALGGARYKVVSGTDQYQREQGIPETKSEDEILSHNGRGKLLDLTRNAVRNNSTLNTILKQFELNAIGNEGGKAILTFDDLEFAKYVREQFANWTRQCDFYDGLNLNTLLKIILKTQLIGGDCVLIFDDGLIKNSGRILLYEPDEIGNTTDEAIEKRYGKNYTQSLGRVYNNFGQFSGCVVSKNQRGLDVFDASKSYLLKRNPDGSIFDDLWIMPRNIYRISQGRGVSPFASSLGTIIDLNDYLSFELASAKKNAQTLAVVQQLSDNDTIDVPSTFDDVDLEKLSDDEIKNLIEEQNQYQPTMTLDKITSAGCIYQTLPNNYKLELLDTKHPNNNSIDFVRWLQQASSSPLGLARCYSTLNVDSSYTAFRGEMVLTWSAFEEAQHNLEQTLDWIFYRWIRFAIKNKIIEDKLPENYMRKVSWCFPKMRDIDGVKEQNAVNLKLKNGTSTLREIIGSDWREKLKQISEEIDYCKKLGIPHPMLETKSGMIIDTSTEKDEE